MLPAFQTLNLTRLERNYLNRLIEEIEDISARAHPEGNPGELFIDLDRQQYWFSTEQEQPTESPEDVTSFPEELWVYQVVTREGRQTSGRVSLKFFPDGSREFGLIYVRQLQTGKDFTIYLNPYSLSVTVYQGEIYFEEIV
ncbi:MAG: hypothetical protein NC823_02935 [Candidatus Omnitrophica bacterium]|nr:hypothetical protein [Candidatus Omnitrophota bacterium]